MLSGLSVVIWWRMLVLFRIRFCRHPVSREYVEGLEDRVRVLENVVFGCVRR